MKVNILSPIGKGGPYHWAKNLGFMLSKKGINTRCINTFEDLMITPLYQNADIVHTVVPLCYKLWRKPVVLTVKGDFTVEKKIWKLFYPLAISKANVITTPSHFLKDKLDLENATVIPNSIDTRLFKKVNHFDKENINLVTVSHFSFKDKSEGILDIMKLIEDVQKCTNKNIHYTVVGGGVYLDYLIEKTKSYSVDINFTGFLSNPKDILEKSDIFVYYSNHDNFPNVILEAMASGLPVVTNKVGAVSEILDSGSDGYITENNGDYINHLLNLISNHKLRTTIGENARRNVKEKFDWNNVVEEYVSIYKNLLE